MPTTRLRRAARDAYHRFYDWYGDRKFNVRTRGFLEPHQTGVTQADAMAYSALEYSHLLKALPAIPFPPEEVVFLDYGCGMGRALAAAARHPFRKVLGVEISATLADAARANLARLRRRRAGIVEVHQADAAGFGVPPDANVIFFFNPFAGDTLIAVLQRLRESWSQHPRELFIIFFNHREFDRQLCRQPVWLEKLEENEFRAFYRSL
jgi:SAM-dependent methyltransferase